MELFQNEAARKRSRQVIKKMTIKDEVTGKEVVVPFFKHLYGTEPRNIKMRSCLKCQTRFCSAGPQNRICGPCNLWIDTKAMNSPEEVTVRHHSSGTMDLHAVS